MPNKIVVINYGMGNAGSVIKKLKRIGCEPIAATDPAKKSHLKGSKRGRLCWRWAIEECA